MSKRNTELFTRISNGYDFMNHAFSFGSDILWRHKTAVMALESKEVHTILDVGTGTGDLALDIARRAKADGKKVSIDAIDLSSGMLAVARKKAKNAGIGNISFGVGDGLKTEFENTKFDVSVSAFTLRNFDDLDRFAKEMHRVLKPGGKLLILEIALPEKGASRVMFNVYFKLMRAVGSIVDKEAYTWLVESMRKFDRRKLNGLFKAHGFKDIKKQELGGGVAFILSCEA